MVGHADAGAVRSEAAGSISYQLGTSMRHIGQRTHGPSKTVADLMVVLNLWAYSSADSYNSWPEAILYSNTGESEA